MRRASTYLGRADQSTVCSPFELLCSERGFVPTAPPQLSSLRSFVIRTREEAYLDSSAALQASFLLLQERAAREDAAAATLEIAEDATVLADVLDDADTPSSQLRAAAERALAAHRAAAIEAANAVRLSTAADARYRDLNSHAHRVSDFTQWAAQHVSGLIRSSQIAAVRSHRAQKAAVAARAAAAPRLTPAERRTLTGAVLRSGLAPAISLRT